MDKPTRDIVSVRDAAHPIALISHGTEPTEYATLDYASHRLTGWYDVPAQDIARDLMAGVPFRTISYVYRRAE